MWTDPILDRLRELCRPESNLSFKQIADTINAEFGTSISRNAVIGKARRLGITNERQPGAQSHVGTPQRVQRAHERRIAKHEAIKRAQPIAVPDIVEALPPDNESKNVTFLALEAGMCRWPTGDGVYCGCATVMRKSYCAKHHSAGTEPAKYRGLWGVRAAYR